MSVRAQVRPELLIWARERSGLPEQALRLRFPKLEEWETGARSPTLKQLEGFASATHTPVGFLFLQEPPDEPVPIPDFRVMGDESIGRPSADLLDTIFQCQQRQEWYRDFAQLNGEAPVAFVGSIGAAAPVADAAASMRKTFDFGVEARGSSWTEALRRLIDKAEDAGVLVMVSGVVGNNTHRKLDPREFRGFALVDQFAPLVFVNGADTKAAQIFTLAHELAHIWRGQSALSDADLTKRPAIELEQWCNQVASEFLAPIGVLAEDFSPDGDLTDELERLARRFKVSTLVVLRRVHDAGYLSWDAYRAAYRAELERILEILEARGATSGGDFYNTQPLRVSRRFARAVIESTVEGQTLQRDAFQMLGFKKVSTFYELAHRIGVS